MAPLLISGSIPDPFVDYNELKCEWVAETSWTYKTTLPKVEKLLPHQTAILDFDGLDTFATVYLNSKRILVSDNMFLSHRVDITSELSTSTGSFGLEIRFESAFKKAREIKDRHPEHKWVGYNGDMARLAVRKAQYHWYVIELLPCVSNYPKGLGLGSYPLPLRPLEASPSGNISVKNFKLDNRL
jgi:beta-mannosidase